MPFDKRRYPPYWKQFSEWVRFDRAKNKCEKCGIENRSINGRGARVVLTVAHLDNKGGVCDCFRRHRIKCSRTDHVLALCQACHLALDREAHVAVRRKNRVKQLDLERGLFQGI